jgi:tRNA threonylcarbamoyladenosine biosynthesis protein TsaE
VSQEHTIADASFTTRVEGLEGTERFGRALAGRFVEGDVVLLLGGLATGKTALVKAVVAALGSSDLVTSPTFSLAQFYTSPAAPVLHIDTYRLPDLAEFRDLGLDEHMASSITLIEWGGLVAGEFEEPLVVDIRRAGADDAREIVVSASGRRWVDVLPRLCTELDGRSS